MSSTTTQKGAKKETRRFGRIPLGSISGIRIRADWSVLIIVALVAFNLGLGLLPEWHPDWSFFATWGVSFGAAFLFLASILVHELSHAVVGRRMGIPVHNITLFIFGGMAHTEKEPDSPKAEALMAGVGPVTSLAIGVASTLGGLALSGAAFGGEVEPAIVLAEMGPVATLLLWLGPINILLGLFNMVPGFPLDGGRVLRAALWAMTGSLEKATKWASWAGQGFAAVLAAWGVVSLLDGVILQGAWLLFIAWFLRNAARAGYQQTLLHETLSGTRVGEIMRRHLQVVPPRMSLTQLVHAYLTRSDQGSYPVVSDEGRLEGVIALSHLQAVPSERWDTTSVATAMTPIGELRTAQEQTEATDILRHLGDVEQLPVVDRAGVLRGMVRRQDVMRWLALNDRRRHA